MLSDLVKAVRRYTETRPGTSPYQTPIGGLTILRSNEEKRPDHLIFRPALCLVVQGAKWAIFGDRRLDYGPGQALVVSVELPAFGRVAEASPSEPFLGLIIEFDLTTMREVLEAMAVPPKATAEPGQGVFVADVEGTVVDCALRMVRLLDTPEAIAILYPALMRELCYRLLAGPRGGDIAKMVLSSSHEHRIVSAIHFLRARFAEPVAIEQLADVAGLSPSAFHRQFKAVTSMTPLQYQKQLRLIEARRLMVADALTAETAAFRVGYESPSQFSREYARMFGVPPRRDVLAVRAMAA